MLPILLGLAGITIAASAFAWFCDELTEEEQQKHDALRKSNDELRDQLTQKQREEVSRYYEQLYEAAVSKKQQLANVCETNKNKIFPIATDLERLRIELTSQLKQSNLSPYKTNALKQLKMRLDDAVNRLKAYDRYCNWYIAALETLERQCDYQQLIDFDIPESRLPSDWFYVGKVGLVERYELNQGCNSNRYNQYLKLPTTKTPEGKYVVDSVQLSMAQAYPEQEAIPIQLKSVDNSGRNFIACIIRGVLYVDHILEQLSCKAFVTESKESGYAVTCYPEFYQLNHGSIQNSGISAFLPRSETQYPGKTYKPGYILNVFFQQYDLLLQAKPTIIVTERETSLRIGMESIAPVYMCFNKMYAELDDLAKELEFGAQWNFRNCQQLESGELLIDFQLGGLIVKTISKPEELFLTIESIDQSDPNSIDQTSLPFEIQIIENSLIEEVILDKYQVNQLKAFCQQQSIYGKRSGELDKAWWFFERWKTVADYLLEKDGFLTAELFPNGDGTDGTILCECEDQAEEQLNELIEQIEENQSTNRRRTYLQQKYLDSSGGEVWINSFELESLPVKNGKKYQIKIKTIERENKLPALSKLVSICPVQLRLRDRKNGDFQNLVRQKQALESFVRDNLLNKDLKQILIDPAGYKPQPDLHWQQKINKGLTWNNPNWQDPAKGISTKLVIENALVESNLFLIQGPPGTGKTTCIVEMLHQLYSDNPNIRVLVVSQQNAAVDNALKRFLSDSPHLSEKLIRIGKKGKIDDFLSDFSTDQRLDAYYADRISAKKQAELNADNSEPYLQDWISSIRNCSKRFGHEHEYEYDPELCELILGEYNLVGATCVGLAKQIHGLHRLKFDVAIIDEAGRSTVPELMIPLLRCRKVILIGDHFQLPPSIAATLREKDTLEDLPFIEETFLKQSFFERLFNNLPDTLRGRLTDQFRMVEPIGDLVGELFYKIEGKRFLTNGKAHDRIDFIEPECCLGWIDVRGKHETKGTSKFNQAEADAICNYLQIAQHKLSERKLHKNVAIITPYGAQKNLLRNMLTKKWGGSADSSTIKIADQLDIRVDTVDSFQGSEADIVLYSTVRTEGNISFIQDRQRLNVSCSRAKENLVFLGNSDFLQRAELSEGYQGGGLKLFTEIIRHCDLMTVQIVTIYSFLQKNAVFAKNDIGIEYYVPRNCIIGKASKKWSELKNGDQLIITASSAHSKDKAAMRAISAVIL